MQPRLGVQGPVVGWQDPWGGPESDAIMRTGTGVLLDSQDGYVPPADFLSLLRRLGADFYVHHVLPGLQGQQQMITDVAAAGLDVVLGNEYGNINGPHVPGTNRYDLPDEVLRAAATSGHLLGVLYDEPEHLQINAGQYLDAGHHPHFGSTEGLPAGDAEALIADAAGHRVAQIARATGSDRIPMIAEHVFPVMFHTFARAGIAPCPKVLKESFQPLQLSTALGAALQYDRPLWICADLWGPDIGPWFTRAPGFPGHSPEEFAAALRMAYLFGPSHLFVENVDVLSHFTAGRFTDTAFGEVWAEFATDFVPAHPLGWTFRDARPSTVLIHAEDSDFGRGSRPFGDRTRQASPQAASVFAAWHLLSRGTLPADASSPHAGGVRFPRGELSDIPRADFPLPAGRTGAPAATRTHRLFHALNNVVVFDEQVTAGTLGDPELIVVAGSRLPEQTRALLLDRAAAGATVLIADWLTGPDCARSRRLGSGRWVVTPDFDPDGPAGVAAEPQLGPADAWTQRFNDTTVRFTPGDPSGITLDWELLPAAAAVTV